MSDLQGKELEDYLDSLGTKENPDPRCRSCNIRLAAFAPERLWVCLRPTCPQAEG